MTQLKHGGVQGKHIDPLKKNCGMQERHIESDEQSKHGDVH